MDGTYYQKGGIVSSGKVSLQEKAKRWMAEEILQVNNRKVCEIISFIALNIFITDVD